MPTSDLTEVTVADTGYITNWVFASRDHGLVGTTNVPLILMDLDEHEDIAGWVSSTGTYPNQTMRLDEHYLEIEVEHRKLHFCVRLPVPEYDELVNDILEQSNVCVGDFEAFYGNDAKARTAILLTFENGPE